MLEAHEEAMLFTLGAMHKLAEEGILKAGEQLLLTPKGIAAYDQLKASGRKVEDDELRKCLLYIMTNEDD